MVSYTGFNKKHMLILGIWSGEWKGWAERHPYSMLRLGSGELRIEFPKHSHQYMAISHIGDGSYYCQLYLFLGGWTSISLPALVKTMVPMVPFGLGLWPTAKMTGWGWLEHGFDEFPYIGNNIPNWRTHIFQRGWLKPPTRWSWHL